jgi:hypothetical protein
MSDDETTNISPDDILEEGRPGKLTAAVGDDPLPEDNDPPAVDEPDHDEEGDTEEE